MPKAKITLKPVDHLTPKMIYDEVNKTVVGQEEAKKVVANIVFMHFVRYMQNQLGENPATKKSNALLMGPTGCGKTYIVRETAKAIRKLTGYNVCPTLEVDCTELTPQGYVGDSIKDLLKEHAGEYGGEETALNTTIVFLDEFDKICMNQRGTSGLDMGRGAQYNILKVMEGLTIPAVHKMGGSTPEFDTSDFLFILAGNFAQIRSKRECTKKPIGFADHSTAEKFIDYHTELDEAGMATQLVGRTSQVGQLYNLNEPELMEILDRFLIPELESTWDFLGEELKVPKTAKKRIVNNCFRRKTGARGLETDLSKYLEDKIFKLKYKY